MPGGGAERAPLRRHGARRILYRIKRILHPFPHFVHWHRFVFLAELTGHAGVDAEDRYGAEILRELEIFVISHHVRGMVAPFEIPLRTALPAVADRVLPAVRPVERRVAFHPASAGEAEELRLQVGEHPRNVLPAPVALERMFGHERNVVDVEVASGRRAHHEARRRHIPHWTERQFVLLPFLRDVFDLGAGDAVLVRPFKRNRDRPVDVTAQHERKLVVVGACGVDAEIPLVADAAAVAGRGEHAPPVLFAYRLRIVDADVRLQTERLPVLRAQTGVERTVTHHLGVERPVDGHADILEEYAPQSRGEVADLSGRVDAHGIGVCGERAAQCRGECTQRRFLSCFCFHCLIPPISRASLSETISIRGR